MCGISGIYSFGSAAPPASRDELAATRDAMAARGPDGANLWISGDGTIALAHRRLSVIDLSESGAQPMATPDGRVRITFNGEIYNFRVLRRHLEARGQRFRSASDTEVLLHLYLLHGQAMVEHLRGMFAFAIWDEQRRQLMLARDPFGIKPLYYSESEGVFRFASQVKALLAGGEIDAAPDPAGHAGFFLWGSVPEPFTTYRAIKALPAGSTMVVDGNGLKRPSRYFCLRDRILAAEEAGVSMSDGDVGDALSQALRDSVKHHLVSDVPVGLFLSSGIDSSVLTALTSELGSGTARAVTIGFREYRGTRADETRLARVVAEACGARHEISWIDKREFKAMLPSILDAMDQPSIDGVNTYLVSRAAAQAGLKVALSGIGGDELFGGYPSFRDVPRLERLPALGVRFPRFAAALRRAANTATRRWISPKFAGIAQFAGTTGGAYLLRRGLYMPWELDDLMDRDLARQGLEELATMEHLAATTRGIRSARLRVTALELSWYMRNQLLRDADWAGMAHSLEIRLPLVDAGLFVAMLPSLASNRPPSKRVMAYAPQKPLPREIIERRKTGFVVPVAEWIRHGQQRPVRGLRGWARQVNRAPGVGYRVLALLTDAYGGIGGIARFNRNLLAAMSSHPGVREIVVIPRGVPLPPEPVHPKVRFLARAAGSKTAYIAALLRSLLGGPAFDLIVCGHINLAPAAYLAACACRSPSFGILHGVDAWSPPASVITRIFVRRIDRFAGVSNVTIERFRSWSSFAPSKLDYLPNTVVLEEFGPGPKDQALIDRYKLRDKRVLLTVGRLVAAERYKGFDCVIHALPSLLHAYPDIVYLIVGDGTDRQRLVTLAERLGVAEHVRFAGYVPDKEKAAHFRLADAFVMPSKGEGFGIVLLEAMACGIPVVASKVDGSREAVLDGRLGTLVDPDVPEEVLSGIKRALECTTRLPPEQLRDFAFPAFESRSHRLLEAMLNGGPGTAAIAA